MKRHIFLSTWWSIPLVMKGIKVNRIWETEKIYRKEAMSTPSRGGQSNQTVNKYDTLVMRNQKIVKSDITITFERLSRQY